MMSGPDEADYSLTGLAVRACHGDSAAAEALLPRIYDQLRAIAGAHVHRHVGGGHTLQATALVNEAYIKLAEGSGVVLRDRKHLFALLGKIMRQVLVDHARAAHAQKRGGGMRRVTLSGVAGSDASGVDLLALEEALYRLHEISPRRADLVEMRFFGGLREDEGAEALGISRAEASRQWRAARAWLALRLRDGDDDDARAE